MTVLSSSSKEYSTWLIMACAVAPEASYHADVGALLDELAAGLEVVVPRPEERGDLLAVGGHPGLLEQVGAVAHGLGADVGPVADQRAVRRRGGLGLPVQPATVDLGVGEVLEGVGLLHEGGPPVDLDRLDVGESRAGRELGVEVVLVLVGRAGLLLLDDDVVLHRVVLLDELLVAELVEGGDGQLDLAVRRLPRVAVVAAAARGRRHREGERHQCARGEPYSPGVPCLHHCTPAVLRSAGPGVRPG